MKFKKVESADPENGRAASYVVVGHEHLSVTQVPSIYPGAAYDWVCRVYRDGSLYNFCSRQPTRKALVEAIELNLNQGA